MSKITVFTTSTCAYCQMVKKYLANKGREFETVDLDQEPETRQRLFETTGAMTVPITQIDEDYIIGWDVGRLSALLH